MIHKSGQEGDAHLQAVPPPDVEQVAPHVDLLPRRHRQLPGAGRVVGVALGEAGGLQGDLGSGGGGEQG